MNYEEITAKAKALISAINENHSDNQEHLKGMADGVLMLWEATTKECENEPWRKATHKELLIARYGERQAEFFIGLHY